MIVCAAANECEPQADQFRSKRLAVGHNLFLVALILLRLSLFQCRRQRCDGVIVGPSLESWEHSEIDAGFQIIHDGLGSFLALMTDPLNTGAHMTFLVTSAENTEKIPFDRISWLLEVLLETCAWS